MTREQKALVIEDLREKLGNTNFFYVTDSSALTVAEINNLRRMCFEKGVQMQVAKNTLITKALKPLAEEGNDAYNTIFDELKGPTTLMIADNPKAPAEVIKEFRGENEKPRLKAAYIDSSVYIGDDQLETLTKIKTKEELVGEIVTLLQSPAKNVVSALQSGKTKLAGLMKALEERAAS